MNYFHRYLPVALWCLVIFILSSWPVPPAPQDTLLNFLLKKSAHILEYAILYYLVFRAYNHPSQPIPSSQPRTQNSQHYLIPLLFCFFYAISDEIHQFFIPGRHARWYDIGFDTLGAFISSFKLLKTKK